MDYINNYNGVILIVDLETGETTTEDLELEAVEKFLGVLHSIWTCIKSMLIEIQLS